MTLHKAIEKYLQLPASDVLDERIFYNVLKDYRAFEQHSAIPNIVRAFIGKGFLKDIWYGENDWQLKSRQHLIATMGFQESIVDIVVNEFGIAFKDFEPKTAEEHSHYEAPIMPVEAEMQFQKYDHVKPETTNRVQKPESFNMRVNDIVMAKNGTARIVSIMDEYITVKYLKHCADNTPRKIYYDENVEYVITPGTEIFLKSTTGRYFYIAQSIVDSENAKFIGTYADRICKMTLMPYFIHKNGFSRCSEGEFLMNCKDLLAFNEFRMNNK